MTPDYIKNRLSEIQDLILRDRELQKWHANRDWDRNAEWDEDRIIELERERESLTITLGRNGRS